MYTTDRTPGITRERRGRGFAYRRPDGRLVADASDLQRIRSLAIPPAWTDVWISVRPTGHLQATGRDARGRKQHRYHQRWTAVRDEVKYSRMLEFARALPGMRRQTDADLAQQGVPQQKVLATVVKLLERTLIRVGNDEYARDNRSYGLTTLQDRHAKVTASGVRFRFRGKSGKTHDISIRDARLARIVKRCQDLPGRELFQYVDDRGRVRDITSTDVNRYLRSAMGRAFTAKDFRTWAGTVLAARALDDINRTTAGRPANRHVVRAVDEVSEVLGNTRSVCRKCYVHPVVIDAYLDGSLSRSLRCRRPPRIKGLERWEVSVLQFLESRLAADARRAA